MNLYHSWKTTKGGLGTDIGDRRYRVRSQHRLCNIYPVGRYRLFLRGIEIGGGETEFPCPPDSTAHPSLDRVRSSEQSGRFGHPPDLQILSDPRGANNHPILHERA